MTGNRGNHYIKEFIQMFFSRLLRSGNLVAERDIVQFVEMKQFVSGGGHWNKELLAREVLAEIPAQLSSYMKKKSFKPLTQS